MALKELSVKEALQMLAEKYPEPVEGYISDESEATGYSTKYKLNLSNIHMLKNYKFAIEVPDEYRYMTQQEHNDWLCLVGYKEHQMKLKGNTEWVKPYSITTPVSMSSYEYRTIQEIDGKIVYGEPQEFKIKV